MVTGRGGCGEGLIFTSEAVDQEFDHAPVIICTIQIEPFFFFCGTAGVGEQILEDWGVKVCGYLV